MIPDLRNHDDTLVPEVSLVDLFLLKGYKFYITKKKYQAKEKPLVTTVYNLTFMRSNSDHRALIG